MRDRVFGVVLLSLMLSGWRDLTAADLPPFVIQAVDEQTGRGIPLVELETINHIRFVTDNAGCVVISDPDLVGQKVYFQIHSHGYHVPKDGFGLQGQAFQIDPGQQGTVKLRRDNLAERLYRVTGSGLYRDTLMAGRKSPIEQPLLNGKVFGCDSVLTAIYQGKIYWFWGDTLAPHYPLGGSFHMTGATSQLLSQGGLPPEQAVNLEYFVDQDGVAKPLAKMPGDGPTWVTGITVLRDEAGRERMYGSYVKIRNMLESYRWGFVVWNDDTNQFDEVVHYDERPRVFLEPQAHSFLHQDDSGTDYVYFSNPFPLTRVPAKPAAFVEPTQYEGWTCLKPGSSLSDPQLNRDASGRLQFSWQKNMPPLTQKLQQELIKSGAMKPEEASIAVRDIDSAQTVQAHFGSTFWNDYRQKWISIFTEEGGISSHLGEIWYAESDRPTGPWKQAKKIISHDKYTFYNPKIHPQFDEAGGRVIYFEGTYTQTFSGNLLFTPRYDYNQIMYRLDLEKLRYWFGLN